MMKILFSKRDNGFQNMLKEEVTARSLESIAAALTHNSDVETRITITVCSLTGDEASIELSSHEKREYDEKFVSVDKGAACAVAGCGRAFLRNADIPSQETQNENTELLMYIRHEVSQLIGGEDGVINLFSIASNEQAEAEKVQDKEKKSKYVIYYSIENSAQEELKKQLDLFYVLFHLHQIPKLIAKRTNDKAGDITVCTIFASQEGDGEREISYCKGEETNEKIITLGEAELFDKNLHEVCLLKRQITFLDFLLKEYGVSEVLECLTNESQYPVMHCRALSYFAGTLTHEDKHKQLADGLWSLLWSQNMPKQSPENDDDQFLDKARSKAADDILKALCPSQQLFRHFTLPSKWEDFKKNVSRVALSKVEKGKRKASKVEKGKRKASEVEEEQQTCSLLSPRLFKKRFFPVISIILPYYISKGVKYKDIEELIHDLFGEKSVEYQRELVKALVIVLNEIYEKQQPSQKCDLKTTSSESNEFVEALLGVLTGRVKDSWKVLSKEDGNMICGFLTEEEIQEAADSYLAYIKTTVQKNRIADYHFFKNAPSAIATILFKTKKGNWKEILESMIPDSNNSGMIPDQNNPCETLEAVSMFLEAFFSYVGDGDDRKDIMNWALLEEGAFADIPAHYHYNPDLWDYWHRVTLQRFCDASKCAPELQGQIQKKCDASKYAPELQGQIQKKFDDYQQQYVVQHLQHQIRGGRLDMDIYETWSKKIEQYETVPLLDSLRPTPESSHFQPYPPFPDPSPTRMHLISDQAKVWFWRACCEVIKHESENRQKGVVTRPEASCAQGAGSSDQGGASKRPRLEDGNVSAPLPKKLCQNEAGHAMPAAKVSVFSGQNSHLFVCSQRPRIDNGGFDELNAGLELLNAEKIIADPKNQENI